MADTLEDVMRIRDQAEAVRCLAQKAKLGLEMQNEAAAFKLRAERKAGERLAALTRRGRRGTQMYQAGTFRLEELGISRNQSSRWQREAAVPEQDFEAYLREALEAQEEVTAAELLRRAAARSSRRTRPRTVCARREGAGYVVDLLDADPWVVSDPFRIRS